jgi:hypothetical protein
MSDQWTMFDSLMKSAYIPAIEEHRYYDALTVATVIYLMSREDEDIAGGAALIQTVSSIILEKEQGGVTEMCSFCGEKPPKVKLGAGGGGKGNRMSYICNLCVESFHAAFQEKSKS